MARKEPGCVCVCARRVRTCKFFAAGLWRAVSPRSTLRINALDADARRFIAKLENCALKLTRYYEMALAALMRLVKRYKLGLRELNYADELRVPTLRRPTENEFIFVILVGRTHLPDKVAFC